MLFFSQEFLHCCVQEQADRKAALELQAAEERTAREERDYQAQFEQERQDHELALRLAQESNGQLEESPPSMRKYVYCQTATNYYSYFN